MRQLAILLSRSAVPPSSNRSASLVFANLFTSKSTCLVGCRLPFSLDLRRSYSATLDAEVPKTRTVKVKSIDLKEFSSDKIRNFCIVAHIDHGKSTLSDRLLEETELVSREEQIEQFTDKLQVEKERGITVKSTTVSLIHKYKKEKYLLNLIDTPGHADFGFEVHRSMPVCQGAILLVDASKGIQAQTISHFNRALLSDLSMVPVLNKIDVSFAKPDLVIDQMKELFAFDRDEIFQISAKTGQNVPILLDKVVELIPPPPAANQEKPFEALIFDSWHVANEGVFSLVCVRNGELRVGDKIKFFQSPEKVFEVQKLGIFHPDETQTDRLSTGQIGFVSAFVHDLNQVQLGDLIFKEADPIPADYKPESLILKPKQMVYASLFPYDQKDLPNLKQAIKKIHLTDKSVEIEQDMNQALGAGFRLGFQGLLHMSVFGQRLDQEFDAPVVLTSPSVAYKVKLKGAKNIKAYGGEYVYVRSAFKLPDQGIIERVDEPMIKATIMAPTKYIDELDALTRERRGVKLDAKFVDQHNVLMINRYPLSEVITDFLDTLKQMTSGYASFDYEEDGWQSVDVVVLTFNINKEPLDELTIIVPKSRSKDLARLYCSRIKKSLKQQLYDVVIHGCINSRIICKEELKATGKNVLDRKLTGGDETRKSKLLKHQETGRKRLRERVVGRIPISRDLLVDVLRKN